MPDEIDRAQEANDLFQSDALAAHQRRAQQARPGQGLDECVDCGEPIPEARRRAVPGCQRCIDCQADSEAIHTNWRAL